MTGRVPVAGALALWLVGSAATAAEPPPKPPPTDAQCARLPEAELAAPFRSGEALEFTLDALGAQAGKLVLRVLAPKTGTLPVEARAETNAFFSKIRRVRGKATSYLDPARARPQRYVEDAVENEIHRTADVRFDPGDHAVDVQYTIAERPGSARFRYANEGLDGLSVIYALRRLPLKPGLPLCMDVYGIRRLWRLSGRIVEREHLSMALGEFDAWHLVGEAVRLDNPEQRREVHVWISDDARRLPLVAVGSLDLGIVRATLIGYRRPGEKPVRAQPKSDLKW